MLMIYLIGFEIFNPIPNKEDLETYSIKVINTQEEQPHLFVELPDGQKRMMEYPILDGVKPQRYTGIDKNKQIKLRGCTGFVRGTPVHWGVDRFRIWHIECGQIILTYDQARKEYANLVKISLPLYLIEWFLLYAWSYFIFWSEGKQK